MYHVKEEVVYMGVDIAKAYLDAAIGNEKYYATDYCGVYAEGFKTVDKEVADMEKTDLRDYSLADTKVAFPEAKVAVITYKVTMHSTFAGQDTSGDI